MKILIVERGFHGIAPMLELLEEQMITNVQFLLHSEKRIKEEYECFCKSTRSDPYDENVATKYLEPWMKAWKSKNYKNE